MTAPRSRSALAMASFLKPMSRAKIDALLAGVLDRAEQYNADHGKPYSIVEIAVFGSYLDLDAPDFGDLDLAVKYGLRTGGRVDPAELLAYARARGRTFANVFDEMALAERAPLRNRSGYIHVHTEDVTGDCCTSR